MPREVAQKIVAVVFPTLLGTGNTSQNAIFQFRELIIQSLKKVPESTECAESTECTFESVSLVTIGWLKEPCQVNDHKFAAGAVL